MKRIAIYVHYEKNGKVLDYERFFISELLKDFSKVIVVSNGEIDEHAMTDLNNVEIIKRENRGFDFGAWKDVIVERYESEIINYDQLLITNNSVYGPIGSFSEMISEMDSRDCDFWGINRHPANDCCIIKNDNNTRCFEHLQSYWLVFRGRLLHSEDFITYWRELPELDTFKKAVGYGEVRLTHYFEQLGYKSDSFADFEKYSSLTDMNPCFFTYEQVREDRIPVIKRKYFYDYFEQAMSLNLEFKARKLLKFLSENKLYNIDYIREDLFSVADFKHLFQSIGLFCSLPVALPLKQYNSAKAKLFLIINENSNSSIVEDWIKILSLDWQLIIVKSNIEFNKCASDIVRFNSSDFRVSNGSELSALVIINSLDGCSVSSIKAITEEFQMLASRLKNPDVSEKFAENSHLSLLLPFPKVSGESNNLAVYSENFTQPAVYCYGRINVISAFAESFVNNEINFRDGRFLEKELGASAVLRNNCAYAEYFADSSNELIAEMYYQLANVHNSVCSAEILFKIERQIKRIRRNNFFARIFWWKKDYYKLKNQRHLKMIDQLLMCR